MPEPPSDIDEAIRLVTGNPGRVTLVARSAAWSVDRARSQCARDLIESAPGILVLKLNAKPPSFQGPGDRVWWWAQTVLRNELINCLRRTGRWKTVDDPALEGATPSSALGRTRSESASKPVKPFPPAVQAIIEGWRPGQRVVWLAFLCCWRRLPEERWNTYLTDFEVDPPFPPVELDEVVRLLESEGKTATPANVKNAWFGIIADALGWTRNDLSVFLYRNKQCLEDLPPFGEDAP